jgi:hypothetical protein
MGARNKLSVEASSTYINLALLKGGINSEHFKAHISQINLSTKKVLQALLKFFICIIYMYYVFRLYVSSQ